jgi:hypothetical protein
MINKIYFFTEILRGYIAFLTILKVKAIAVSSINKPGRP